MIHGADEADLQGLKDQAKQVVMNALVRAAERDGVPPTMRAMYVLKTAEARNVLLGEHSNFIAQEAAMRGITMEELAQQVITAAEESERAELQRVGLGLAIEAAEDHDTVVQVLSQAGLQLPTEDFLSTSDSV